MPRNWTLEDVKQFDTWLQLHHGAHVVYPVKELRAGYGIAVASPPGFNAQEALEDFDKEYVNGTKRN